MLKTKALRNIEQYNLNLTFQKFLTISIYLKDSLNTLTEFPKCCNDELINFCDVEETLKAEYEKDLEDIENFDDISNLCES